MALQALTGNHGRLGAGLFAKPVHAFPRTSDRLQRPDLVPDGTRTINIVDVSRVLQRSLLRRRTPRVAGRKARADGHTCR